MAVGYGLAIAENAVAILITAMAENWTRHYMLIPVLMCLLFVAYGFRLSFFLLKREFKNATFRKTDVAKGSLSKNKEKNAIGLLIRFVYFIFIS